MGMGGMGGGMPGGDDYVPPPELPEGMKKEILTPASSDCLTGKLFNRVPPYLKCDFT